MKDREAMKAVMKAKGFSYSKLADACGYQMPSNVSSLINGNRTGLRSDSMIRLLEAMECELVIRDKATGEEWVLE